MRSDIRLVLHLITICTWVVCRFCALSLKGCLPYEFRYSRQVGNWKLSQDDTLLLALGPRS